MEKKAIIAMSGGVDSSVAAWLMLEQGYECIGATMKLFSNEDIPINGESSCCSLSDVEDARAVAYRLGMDYHVFNFTGRFRQDVMDRFVCAYEKAMTPNPCIDCNRYLKFDKMLQRMHELDYDYVVTGHYARVEFDSARGRYLLRKGLDTSKDQSNVLYNLPQEQLAHVQFHIGSMSKTKVREIAVEHGFVNARKKDSQDICFVPDGDYAGFIERYTGRTYPKGDFVNQDGKWLGEHRGLIHYTIGQRRGLGISAPNPLYVCGIDIANNQVILGENDTLFKDELVAEDVNLIGVADLKNPTRVKAKIRYRHKEASAVAWIEGEYLHVKFDEPQRAITSGQAVVLYNEDVVIGGGTIR